MQYPCRHIENIGLIPKTSMVSVHIFAVISRNSESVRLNIRQFSFKRILDEFNELEKDAKINNTALKIEKDRNEK